MKSYKSFTKRSSVILISICFIIEVSKLSSKIYLWV